MTKNYLADISDAALAIRMAQLLALRANPLPHHLSFAQGRSARNWLEMSIGDTEREVERRRREAILADAATEVERHATYAEVDAMACRAQHDDDMHDRAEYVRAMREEDAYTAQGRANRAYAMARVNRR